MNTKIAYFAGFFDGEGCVTVGLNGGIALGIVNTSLEVLTALQLGFGGSISPRKQIVNKPQFVWRVYGDDAVRIAKELIPFSIEKRAQLEVVLAWVEERDKYKSIRVPGKRGTFSDPNRKIAIKQTQELLTKMKKGTNVS